jgi:hypothetical protein
MMFLKIMGSENVPDHDGSKPHAMVSVSEYRTGRDDSGELFISYRHNGSDHQQRVFSNIYVMNVDGKTINAITPTSGIPI